MPAVTDIRTISESALGQLADRFDRLPRPLLAAIGAGDLAVEQLALLRAAVLEQLAANAEAARSADVRRLTTELPAKAQHLAAEYAVKVQHAATDLPDRAQQLVEELRKTPGIAGDLPARAQQVAAEAADSIQSFAEQLPTTTQELFAELPEKAAQFTGDATLDGVRDTLDAYTELVGHIYGSLADRGERSWSKVRSGSLRPGVVVDPASEPATRTAPPTKRAATATAVVRQSERRTATRATGSRAATPKASAARAASTRTASRRRAVSHAAAPTTAAPTTAAPTTAEQTAAPKIDVRKPAAARAAAHEPAGSSTVSD